MSYKVYKKENHQGMLGKHHTEKSKEKNRQAHLGKKWKKGQREKFRKATLGRVPWNKGIKQKEVAPQCGFQNGHIPKNKGKEFKHSGSFKAGRKHHMFNNWSSCKPYSKEWNRKLKKKIRERDKCVCVVCKVENAKFVHHIDYDKKNCSEKNLITLCRGCHSKTNFNRESWKAFFKNYGKRKIRVIKRVI